MNVKQFLDLARRKVKLRDAIATAQYAFARPTRCFPSVWRTLEEAGDKALNCLAPLWGIGN